MSQLKSEQGKPSVAEEELKTGLVRAARRMQRLRLEVLFRDHISQGEFFALEIIGHLDSAQGGEQGVPVSQVARRLEIAPSAVSRMLSALEDKGYITREIDRRDRRNIRVGLTPRGRAARDRAAACLDEFSGRVIRRMGDEDTRRLVALLNKMCDMMMEELSPVKGPPPMEAAPPQTKGEPR